MYAPVCMTSGGCKNNWQNCEIMNRIPEQKQILWYLLLSFWLSPVFLWLSLCNNVIIEIMFTKQRCWRWGTVHPVHSCLMVTSQNGWSPLILYGGVFRTGMSLADFNMRKHLSENSFYFICTVPHWSWKMQNSEPTFCSVFTASSLPLSCFSYKWKYALPFLITHNISPSPFVVSSVVALRKANMRRGIITNSSMLIKERVLI